MIRKFMLNISCMAAAVLFLNTAGAQWTLAGSGATGTISTPGNVTAGGSITSNGNLIYVKNNGEARFHLYNEGGVTGWLMGQKSAENHSFILSKKTGIHETDFLNIYANGRVHIDGPELLYLLNQGGVIVGKEWGGNGNLTVEGSLTMGASSTINGAGRLHIDGSEYLYLLNQSGVIVSKAWGGNGNLTVEGTTLASRVKVAVPGGANWNFAATDNVKQWQWADYVFDKEYKLKSLYEVERFIKKNKHLPGIPAAEEIKKEGIDLAEMNAKLLEKVEELTLHLIRQQKEIDALKNKARSPEKK